MLPLSTSAEEDDEDDDPLLSDTAGVFVRVDRRRGPSLVTAKGAGRFFGDAAGLLDCFKRFILALSKPFSTIKASFALMLAWTISL
jgi:hypothetical protein